MIHHTLLRRLRSALTGIGGVVLLTSAAVVPAGDEPMTVETRFQITGFFSPDREKDLVETFAKLPQFEVRRLDFESGEALLRYDPAKGFPNREPDKAVEQLDSLLKQHSQHTFGCRPLCTLPREKLQPVEIAVSGLDCKACSLAAYEAVYRLPGVEYAAASFREGRVVARIDPEKTSRAALETALKERGVHLKAPTP